MVGKNFNYVSGTTLFNELQIKWDLIQCREKIKMATVFTSEQIKHLTFRLIKCNKKFSLIKV